MTEHGRFTRAFLSLLPTTLGLLQLTLNIFILWLIFVGAQRGWEWITEEPIREEFADGAPAERARRGEDEIGVRKGAEGAEPAYERFGDARRAPEGDRAVSAKGEQPADDRREGRRRRFSPRRALHRVNDGINSLVDSVADLLRPHVNPRPD